MHMIKENALKFSLAAALASASIFALAPAVNAGTSTGSFSITSTVANTCGVAFSGNVTLTPNVTTPATPVTGTTGLTITCTGGIVPTAVTMAGANDGHGSATPYFHALSNGSGTYATYGLTATNLGTSAAYADGVPGAWTGTFGVGPTYTSTITVTSLQINTAPPGTYSDSVTATVTF